MTPTTTITAIRGCLHMGMMYYVEEEEGEDVPIQFSIFAH